MSDALMGFEISLNNLDRAARFYEKALRAKLISFEMETGPMRIIPPPEPFVQDALVLRADHKPHAQERWFACGCWVTLMMPLRAWSRCAAR